MSDYPNDENYAKSIHIEQKLQQEEDREKAEKLKDDLSMPHSTSQPNNNSNSYPPSYNDKYIGYGPLQNDRLNDDGIPVIESTIQLKGSKEDLPPSHQDNASIAKLEEEKKLSNISKRTRKEIGARD